MKLQTTRKAVVDYYKSNIIRAGYCQLHHLLLYQDPFAYTAGVYGWNADVYKVGSWAIVTGHRPFGYKVDSAILRGYNKAASNAINETASYETNKARVNQILDKFVTAVEFAQLVQQVWQGRDDGRHGWLEYGGRYLTVEPADDADDDYLLVGLVNKIDALGYPFDSFISYGTLDRNNLSHGEAIALFEYLVAPA